MKITTIDILIDGFRNGKDIWEGPEVEIAVREIERLRKVIELRDDDIESYATLYDKAAALCGFEDALPSAEMDEMILYAIRRGMEPKPTLIDALNEVRNKKRENERQMPTL